jgi:hypothetical protein
MLDTTEQLFEESCSSGVMTSMRLCELGQNPTQMSWGRAENEPSRSKTGSAGARISSIERIALREVSVIAAHR